MSKKATKAADNMFYKARMEAASCNDTLNSREGAAEQIGIDRTRIARIELGSLIPYPEEVLLMSDTYNAPELKAFYCKECCPMGANNSKVVLEDLDRVAIKALSAFKKIGGIRDSLLSIIEDGQITEDEKPELNKILSIMEDTETVIKEFKIRIEKSQINE